MKSVQINLIVLCLLFVSSCQDDDDNFNTDNDNLPNINEIEEINTTAGTADNVSLQELGRLLFWDPILSGEKDIACATCHHPDLGYADGRDLPIGVGGAGLGPNRRGVTPDGIGLVPRNSPTILNTAFNGMEEDGVYNPAAAPMFWDVRERSLEAQALDPLQSFEEMRGHAFDESLALDSIVNRLRNNIQYNNLFTNAFNQSNAINAENIGIAIAAFERTIIAIDSPFDRFVAGNENAMSQQQIRGMNTFNRIGCGDCHSGPMFSDFELHVIGVPDHELLPTSDSGANGTYAFRTPTLRNLSVTGPYFHNGVGRNLEQTIRFYITARNAADNDGNGGGNDGGNNGGLQVNPNVDGDDIDRDVGNLRNFNNNDVEDIIAFIEALDDPNFDRAIPDTVPSGLNPGGNID